MVLTYQPLKIQKFLNDGWQGSNIARVFLRNEWEYSTPQIQWTDKKNTDITITANSCMPCRQQERVTFRSRNIRIEGTRR